MKHSFYASSLLKKVLCALAVFFSSHCIAGLNQDIKVRIEEPAQGKSYSGISNLRGWAVAPEGIPYLANVYIDGEFAFNMVVYGSRGDVGNLYPDYPDSDTAGFSMAFNYKNLVPGEHEIKVRVYDANQDYNEAVATFVAERFVGSFISNDADVDISTTGTWSIVDNQTYLVKGATIEGEQWNFQLAWDTASQSFKTQRIASSGSDSSPGSDVGSGEAYVCVTAPTKTFASTENTIIMRNGAELNNYDGRFYGSGERHVMFKTSRSKWYTDQDDLRTYQIDVIKEPESCFTPDLFEVINKVEGTVAYPYDLIEWDGGSAEIKSNCAIEVGSILYFDDRVVPSGLDVLTAEKCNLY